MNGSPIDSPLSDDQTEADTQPSAPFPPEVLTLTEQQFVAWQRSLSDDARALIDQLLRWGEFVIVARLMASILDEGAHQVFEVRPAKRG